ncbi:endonuclease [SAR202 cluster bacterium AD-804-J14_MRT_500m]|nr:endonuclease [SAR202 cluster bacterium AD-804-J14_MRT_500m]
MIALSITNLLVALAIAIIVTITFWIIFQRTLLKVRELTHQNRSLSTRYGKLTEQFMPFIAKYPFDPHKFRFIGSPIDGVQFEEDRILLIEFKSATSHLSSRQRQIRDLVEDGKVEFLEMRLD